MKRRHFYRLAGLSGFGLFAATGSEMAMAEEKQEFIMDKETLSGILTQASLSFRLRDTLAKYGIPSDEQVLVSLAIEGKEPVSFELAPGSRRIGSEPIVKPFRAAVIEDFVGPADVPFKLIENLRKVSGLPDAVPDEETKFQGNYSGLKK